MRICCLVKYVPDTKESNLAYPKNKTNRLTSKLKLNPDDEKAINWALDYKKRTPGTIIDVVSMGPLKIEEDLKNLIRLGADKVTLISDKEFVGSDSLATSLILSTYLKDKGYKLILTGTFTTDGGTGHIGPQVADFLDYDQFSNVIRIKKIESNEISIIVHQDMKELDIELSFPCLISVTNELECNISYVKYKNINKNVDAQMQLISNNDLCLSRELIGRKGSPTKVVKNIFIKREQKIRESSSLDDQAVDELITYLKEAGYV